jgi:hypothetical protein
MKIPTAIAQEVASADFTDWRRWNPKPPRGHFTIGI